MAPPLSSLYTISFFLALLTTLLVAATLRLLAILPGRASKPRAIRRHGTPTATRVLIVLGSGGHTHEMFYLLRDLDTRRYTHRTYIVSSGDAFSAQRAAEFESVLETRVQGAERAARRDPAPSSKDDEREENKEPGRRQEQQQQQQQADQYPHCTGPNHYNLTTLPRARQIHQPLLTTPFSALRTLLHAFPPLLSAPPLLPNQPPQSPHEAAACDLPDLIITNGPATAVIVVLASLVLRFFDIRGAQSRGKCRTVYVESFARVKTLSLSGKILLRIVDRFLVQWEELEGRGGRAEFWGILV